MACCTVRHLLMTIITFQLVLTIIRQVFDFLGQMWAPILFNFVATLVIIIGLFGAFYNRKSYVAIFLIWQLVAIAWNSFVAAFYLEVGHMSMTVDVLSLGTGSKSWWSSNGPNCEPQYNITQSSSIYELRPISVDNCLLPFHVIEIIQASAHGVLSFVALLLSSVYLCSKRKDDDASILRHDTLGNAATLPSQYSLTYHPYPSSVAYPERGARHRQSTNSLPSRRMKRSSQSRGSSRSTASARRKKRRQRANQDTNSVYQSQSQLVHNQFDVSSLDSFSHGNVNPLYSGSLASTASRYSLYTLNPNATIERICVDSNNSRRQRSPIYMNSSETAM